MNKKTRQSYVNGMVQGLTDGTVSVPYTLLKTYHALQLSEIDVMLIIHLMAYRDNEQRDFPSLEELQARMSVKSDKITDSLQKLMERKLLQIETEVDHRSGIQYERYDLSLLYGQIAALLASQAESDSVNNTQETRNDIFTMIENEFARPLSPMELETISSWLDEDRYSEELIRTALKEAVFAGKLHFRYIDRILLEWSRNRVYNAEQAKLYTQKFRG
ncbi:DnaD domain protein [Longirhabdus pacifica]|uniref:DnaD domain protein n=1 Tax=Longirhabdus pacifica TaxID=2305227 RepID=UPI001008DA58|nr:DnaD domain protein [Longirhabdus pacifica]